MARDIPDTVIKTIAERISSRSTKPHGIPVKGDDSNCETPQIFEIIDFTEIDDTERRFYAIDGSHKSEQFYNGLSVALYTAGYVCYQKGKQICLNKLDDPVILGCSYYPERILITSEQDASDIYDELFELEPVKRLIQFFGVSKEEVFEYKKEAVIINPSSLLSFLFRSFRMGARARNRRVEGY